MMPTALRERPEDQPRYGSAELFETRRQRLRFARSIARDPERKKHPQIAVSVGRLLPTLIVPF